jgi:RNA polymerase sigma-B factor
MTQLTTPQQSRLATRAERSDETRHLLERAHACPPGPRRDALLDEVVLVNREVADAVASRYRGRGVADDDLRQAAYEGLVKAVRKFDPAVRPDLLTYAVPTMRGEVQRWFRDQSWMVRPPRRIQEMQWRVSRSIERLSQDLGREPTGAEIADDLECATELVEEAVQGFGCFHPPSLDRPAGEAGTGASLGDLLPADDDHGQASAEARVALGPVVRDLSERDRRILYLRFFEGLSQHEIGAELGVTQMQVSRLLQRILTRLRHELEDGATAC